MAVRDVAEHDRAPTIVRPRAARAPDRATSVLTLQRAIGNAAVGRMLARQGAAPVASRELVGPAPRERALALLHERDSTRLLAMLRALGPDERAWLAQDRELWRGVRAHRSGLAVWAVRLALRYGDKPPPEVGALSAAMHAKHWLRTRQLLMAYPLLKSAPGLLDAIAYQFRERHRDDLVAMLFEAAGTRAESGARGYFAAHYEQGRLVRFMGIRNFELVRLAGQLRVIVRVRVAGAVTDETLARWEEGILRRWNGKFRLRHGAKTLDVWFVPVFVSNGPTPHHTMTVRAGEGRSNQSTWFDEETGDTAAHEFGHMIGNPDEYALPGSMAEIPASLGLTEAEKRRSSHEGITGTPQPSHVLGYTMPGLLGDGGPDAPVHERHGWSVLEVFNAKLRLPNEGMWAIDVKK